VLAAYLVHDPALPAPTEQEVRDRLGERLAPFKVPRRVHFVSQLPPPTT
jgi:acyl-coenzyme A synthetase/AMP-(fatty) acid ligase